LLVYFGSFVGEKVNNGVNWRSGSVTESKGAYVIAGELMERSFYNRADKFNELVCSDCSRQDARGIGETFLILTDIDTGPQVLRLRTPVDPTRHFDLATDTRRRNSTHRLWITEEVRRIILFPDFDEAADVLSVVGFVGVGLDEAIGVARITSRTVLHLVSIYLIWHLQKG
jgi:hypothetical protein